MDGGAWWAAVHGVAKSWTRLSDFTFTFHFHELEKEMATHSSVLAWRIPGTGEPRGLPSTGSQRVGHDWSDLAAAAVWFKGDASQSKWSIWLWNLTLILNTVFQHRAFTCICILHSGVLLFSSYSSVGQSLSCFLNQDLFFVSINYQS